MINFRDKAIARIARHFGINFLSSRTYWARRYATGGNSGSGSYGRLADFKAEFLNGFVKRYDIKTVVELGCGDGHQLSLARYPSYLGIDLSKEAVALCRERFMDDSSKQFATSLSDKDREKGFDLALSLDVVYHLVEDNVFEHYMRDLFSVSHGYVIVYASNMSPDSFSERFPNIADPHVRHRVFTDWVSANALGWQLVEMVQNPYSFDAKNPRETSFADMFVFAAPGEQGGYLL